MNATQDITRDAIGTCVIDTRDGRFGEVLQVWPLSRIVDVAIDGTTFVTPVPFEHCC